MPVESLSVRDVAAAFRNHPFLHLHASKAEGAGITGADLVELTDPKTVGEVFGVTSGLACRKLANAIKELVSGGIAMEEDKHTRTSKHVGHVLADVTSQQLESSLPPGYQWHYFAS